MWEDTMKKIIPLLVLIAVSAFIFNASSNSSAKTASKSMKRMMGENFQTIQLILKNLITSDYKKLPGKIEVIHEHAVHMGKSPPDGVNTEFARKMFINYAYSLETQSRNMLTVLEELIKHDQKTPQKKGKLNIDYLRVVSARHFGDMITSCVLCHNQFRRKVVDKQVSGK